MFLPVWAVSILLIVFTSLVTFAMTWGSSQNKVEDIRDTLKKMDGKLDVLTAKQATHDTRITVLESHSRQVTGPHPVMPNS